MMSFIGSLVHKTEFDKYLDLTTCENKIKLLPPNDLKANVLQCLFNLGKSIKRNLFQSIRANFTEEYIASTRIPCSDNCYLNNLVNTGNFQESHSNNLYKFSHLEEIFYTKIFKVFKFDPCSIFQILCSFEKKSLSNSNSKIRKPKIRVPSKILEKIGKENDNENTSASKISCSTVFMKILKMNFEEELAESLELKPPSEYNKFKLKKSNSSNQLSQRINKQSKNSMFS
jgi:hypothetical protein